MRESRPESGRQRAIAALVAQQAGGEANRIERLDAFAANAVYVVDTVDGRRLMVKASALHDALRAEAWTCARAAAAGFPAPMLLGEMGSLGPDESAFVMARVSGAAVTNLQPVLPALGSALRKLHATTMVGFGWLAEAGWDARGGPILSSKSWLEFLGQICASARRMSADHPAAKPVVERIEAALATQAEALAKVALGSLCHGDLKADHIYVANGSITAVIDWGDAVVADPLWDIARLAQRMDAHNLAVLMTGYDPEGLLTQEVTLRMPLYGALWMIVDAVVDHRLGHSPVAALGAAAKFFGR